MAVLQVAKGDGNAERAAQGAAGQAGQPGLADWRMRCGILFPRYKYRYLIASYEAVASRILDIVSFQLGLLAARGLKCRHRLGLEVP